MHLILYNLLSPAIYPCFGDTAPSALKIFLRLIYAFPPIQFLPFLCRIKVEDILKILLDQEECGMNHPKTLGRQAMGSSRTARFAVARSDLPFCLMVAGFNSMIVEAQVLRYRDVSDSVIPTLPKARNSHSGGHCRTWKALFTWWEAHKFPPPKFVVRRIFAFFCSADPGFWHSVSENHFV